jgi:hypothetical protein
LKTFIQIPQSIFAGHELVLRHNQTLFRDGSYNVPVFFLLFVCCALLIYVYIRFYKKSLHVFSAVIRYASSQQVQREGHSLFKAFSIALFLIYIICGGVFFTDLSVYMGWVKNIPSDKIIILSISVLGLLILAKRFLNVVFGIIIKEKNATEDSFFQYSFNLYTGGLILFIFCLLIHYSEVPGMYLFPLCLSILGLLSLLRLIKIIVFGYRQYGFSVFHLLLYLCAIEIIPLAVFVKIIVNS